MYEVVFDGQHSDGGLGVGVGCVFDVSCTTTLTSAKLLFSFNLNVCVPSVNWSATTLKVWEALLLLIVRVR